MKRRLTPESRALFEAGRAGLAPTDEDRLRVAKALGLNFGVGAGIASATAKTVAGSTAKTVAGLTVASPVGAGVASGVIAAKWVAIVAVALGVGSGGLALYRAEVARVPSGPVATGAVVESVRAPSSSSLPGNPNENARAHVVTPPAPERPAAGEGPPGVASSPAVGASPPAGESLEAADVALPRRASSAIASASKVPAAVAAAPSGASSALLPAGTASSPDPAPSAGAAAEPSVRVADEARLLREAGAALRAGDTAGAARLLDDHARLFPRGVLAEERDVQRILVLCAGGEADAARAAASRFLTAYPQSLLAGRVRASCGAP